MTGTKMKSILPNIRPLWKTHQRPMNWGSFLRCPQIRHGHKGNSIHLELSPEIRSALANGEPVVALESTIITHGMPYPKNYETALKVENICRAQGAIPATIGILKGQIHVGLTNEQLKELAEKKNPCIKTSRRDFPYVLSQKLNGGTTVSGTMVIAAKAGIPIFVTGGIGGVHRGAEMDFDISADLTELGRTPVAVISSGVKSILDIEKTLEYLETEGVCVATLGPRRDFPAFFTATSGCLSPYHVQNAEEAARLIHCNRMLGSGSGVLIGVPIPEAFQADGDVIEQAIQTALVEARNSHVKGKDVTPFVLNRVNQLTGGASLRSNMALIENNAAVGSAIAVDLSKLFRSSDGCETGIRKSSPSRQAVTSDSDLPAVVVGGSIVDSVVTVYEESIKMNASTHRGRIRQSYGGVGRNLADGMARLGRKPLFLTTLGDDQLATELIHRNPLMETRGMLRVANSSTATYVAILDRQGNFLFGIGDMEVHNELTVDWIKQHEEEISRCSLLVMDGNTPISTMCYVLALCNEARVPVFYEPTDINKAGKPFQSPHWSSIAYTSPNLDELKKMVKAVSPHLAIDKINLHQPLDVIHGPIIEACRPLLDRTSCILVTLGRLGLMVVRRGDESDKLPVAPWSVDFVGNSISATHYPALTVDPIVSVSGAGDCLASGFITGVLRGWSQKDCVALGLRAAECSLKHSPAVPEALSDLKV